MHAGYQPIIEALDDLNTAIRASTTESRSFAEMWGFQYVQADRSDLQYMVIELKETVEHASDDPPEMDIDLFATRVNWIKSNIVPQLWNGNGQTAAPALILSLYSLKAWLKRALPEYEKLEPGTLPTKLARLTRSAKARLDDIVGTLDHLEEKINVISEAHVAAEALPTDLEELKQLRASLLTANTQVAADKEAVANNKSTSDAHLTTIKSAADAAQKLIEKCEEAYQITTTKGLSAAFARRSMLLSVSMWVWVFGLMLALSGVAIIGHERIAALTALVNSQPAWGMVVLNLVLSALSVGAPLWFAWVATKQIGQRFRLQEDYGFKASIAKAYEGYRREASRIDENLEKQLFSIALARLDEEPLRTIGTDNHGSPYHELLAAVRDPAAFAKVREYVGTIKQKTEMNSSKDAEKASGGTPSP